MTDENTFVMPDEWLREIHPRRDSPYVPEAFAPDPDAVDRAHSLVDDARDGIAEIIGDPGTVPEVAEAARAHLRGEPDPLGAAAVALVAGKLHRPDRYGGDRSFVDAWVADHGVAFAAAAFAETAVIRDDRRKAAGPVRWRGGIPACFDWWPDHRTARAMRTHLAAAPEDVYAEAVERLAERRGHELQRLIAAYLAPTRDDWVEELCSAFDGHQAGFSNHRWMVFCAQGRPYRPIPTLSEHEGRRLDVAVTLLDGAGPEAAVPLIADAFYNDDLLDLLGRLPVDDAFRALVERLHHPVVRPVLLAAARRFPLRALRVLPQSRTPRAGDALAVHVRTHRDLAETVLPTLPAESRNAVQRVLDANPRLPDAAGLPPLLTEPPWTRPGKKTKPVVIKDLPLPGARAVAWAPGERDAWAARLPREWVSRAERMDAEEAARVVAGTSSRAYGVQAVFLNGPEDLARPLLASWEPDRLWDVDEWLPSVVARFELDACGLVLSVARRDPAGFGECALPLLSDEVARTMADWLVRLKTAGRTARVWFRRHGAAAAPSLIPDALGKAGPARRAAEHALRFVAERDGREAIVEAARVHGDKAAAAIEALLATDPLNDLPTKIPSIDWVETETLPRLLLRDRTHVLPDDAARHVLTMLAMSKPGDVYAGVQVVRELCDPSSLAEFGWALLAWWEMCGAPSKDNWALTQLALTGDDDTVRRLTPVIRAWPGENGHAKAVTGLDILAAIGTETALMHLHGIAQRVKFKGLKAKAQEKIQELAAELELTAEQLADRLVPDFGLDASGTLTLDYGPRRFVIGFDELLRPTVADEDGTPRKSLPKPGAKDDREVASAAYKRFADLKKDVRTVASDQLTRLETAMVAGRRWPVGEFREFVVAHPLVGHLARRLVWLAEQDDGAAASFRVTEDGTFADASDDTVTLPETARIGVAHPVHLGDGTKAWSELFADYEILQPFEQLGRPVHTLTDAEAEDGHLARFEGLEARVGDLLALTRRGWERGAPQDAGIEHEFSHVAPGCVVVIDLTPGIVVGDPYELGDQRFSRVRMTDGSGSTRGLDPVIVSEVIADLTALTQEATR